MQTFKGPWGWSKLATYRECPQRFKYLYIDKLKEPESEALKRGSEVHDILEKYLNGWSTTQPPVHPAWMPRIEAIKAKGPKTEAAWGLDKAWKPLRDWFQPTVWLRAKSDWYHVEGTELVLGDWKTGKYRVPSPDQVLLYAVAGYSMVPGIKSVRTSMCFVDQPEPPHEDRWSASQLAKARKAFTAKVAPLYKDTHWMPTPGSHCRYCPFSRQKNGPCQY